MARRGRPPKPNYQYVAGFADTDLERAQALRSPGAVLGEQGQRLYDAACGLQLEGIVAKRADSPYKAGRSKDWIKVCTPHGRCVQAERSEKWGK